MSLRVWSRFQASRTDGSLVKLRIQDLPENRHDEVIGFLLKYFVPEELFNKAAGIPQNPKAMDESWRLITGSVKDPSFHTFICCVDQDDDEIGKIVGVSQVQLIEAGSKQFLDIKLETEKVQKVISMLEAITEMYDPFKELNISRYYDDRGLAVHPGFRKLGIAAEFFKARHLACMAHDVPATGALMTCIGSEKAAAKDNWETVLVVNLADFGQQHNVTFKDTAVKYMIWRKM